MLAPALATMLVVLTTDAELTAAELDASLREACRLSFDRADSDGCMSTNDTVILLASGASGVRPDPADFQTQLTSACQSLAQALIRDAEGASHDIAIRVFNAA
ncbi:bifunctional ornithine acetyltransferase/N-acetylglutamate synthase, partial [Escherichia coli]|nr:bifunctional ornithine acetyltransferase/N-acetylglutamate synthase [Escherichia coli]